MRKQDFKKPKFSIDRSRRGDLANQIAAGLRTAINTGFYRAGEILPPVRDLAEILEVSKGVAENAVAKLREEGLISPRPAVGSVVCAPDRPLWKGQVLIIVPPAGNIFDNALSSVIRDEFTSNGYLAQTVTVPRSPGGKFDFSLLELMLRQQTDLVVYMIVVGEDEMNSGSVTVRARTEGEGGKFSVDEFIAKVVNEIETKKH